MGLFDCKHPAADLVPQSGEILTIKEDRDFSTKQMILHCYKCGENIPMSWCRLVGGVDAFLARSDSK